MLKLRIATILFIISLLTMVFPPIAVAGDGTELKEKGKYPDIVGQEYQVDKHTKVKLLDKKYDSKGNLESLEYESTTDLIPQSLDNGNPIDTRWYELKDSGGNKYYVSGANLFSATVTSEGRVSVIDSANRMTTWNPMVFLGPAIISQDAKAKLIKDPINEFYDKNTLEWEYTYNQNDLPINLFNLFNREITIRRWSRAIEGSLFEYYRIYEDIGNEFRVFWGSSGDLNAEGTLSPAIAFDSSDHPQYLNVYNTEDGFFIPASEFKNKVYPITVDPTSTFTTSSYDGEIAKSSGTYAGARNSATGSIRNSNIGTIGQYNVGGNYEVERFAVYFQTASTPDAAVLDSGYLRVYGYGFAPDNNFYVTIQSGMPTYPHAPLKTPDFNRTYYSGNGGQKYTSSWSTSSYNYIYLSSTGLSWINKQGLTKFYLRSSDDINNNEPSSGDYDNVTIREYSYGTGYAPKLTLIYHIPITTPTVSTTTAFDIDESSAYARAYLSDDGGETCVVYFQYGLTDAYGSTTTSESGVSSGEYVDKQITGLSLGTEYHYRAIATNTAGTGYGADKTFTTLPGVPTAVTTTPGDNENVLNWTKGVGATNTLVRFDTTGYPTSVTDGTQIYNSTLATYTHTPITEGVTYYYSLWAETAGSYSKTYATTFGTPYDLIAPEVETRDATGVGVGDADLRGYLVAINQVGGNVTLSFDWDIDSGAPYANNAAAGVLAAPGTFTVNIAGLAAATPHYFRAKAIGTHGTSFGDEFIFTTSGVSSPTMDTTAATGVSLTYATINGEVLDDGGASCTVWFVWGLSEENMDQTTASGTGFLTDGIFNVNLTGLEPDTTYYYQAIGQNTAGIGYGDIVNFSTDAPSAATAITHNPISIGAITATLAGTLSSDGGVECEVQFEWDTDSGAPYANSTGWQEGFNQGESFEAVLSTLAVDTPYYYRASAKNADGTVYGSEVTFTTVFVQPSEFKAKSLGATTISLTWVNKGDQTYIVYKSTGYPVDRLDGTQVYFGDASSATHDGLLAGTTYFYRAWSWRTGDVWSGNYAQDAATTTAVRSSTEDAIAVLGIPGDMPTLYQDPDATGLENMPFYDMFNDTIEANTGIKPKYFWLFAYLVTSLVFSYVAWKATNTVFIGIAVTILFMFGAAQIGIMPLWIPVVYVITLLGMWGFFGLQAQGSK